ncbi:hypothetical protein [Undibacterium sp.]|uniref:hypothetical protein n=1 Tax=Undibacterium sp. TaxID=1914977 RepID=UPI00375075EC
MSRILLFIKRLSLLLLSSVLIWFLVSFVLYRWTANAPVMVVDGVIVYKFLELDLDNRKLFEELVGNRVIRLEGHSAFYISDEDHDKLWPESPHEMAKKNYTIKAKLQVRPLFFGGIATVKLQSTSVLNEQPIIRK